MQRKFLSFVVCAQLYRIIFCLNVDVKAKNPIIIRVVDTERSSSGLCFVVLIIDANFHFLDTPYLILMLNSTPVPIGTKTLEYFLLFCK